MLLILIELNKNIKHAYKHAYKLKFFSPSLSIINKGVKNKTNKHIFFSSFYVQNKESLKGCSPPFCLKSNMIPIKECVKEVHYDTNLSKQIASRY